MKPILVFDTEVYTDYFLLAFRNIETGNCVYFEKYDNRELDLGRIRNILRQNRLISFNGINYDIPVLSAALTGFETVDIKKVSDAIISTGLKPWVVAGKMKFKLLETLDHIDLIEVAPGKASLKLYAGRAHASKLQDLPYTPDAIITEVERKELIKYCMNDLQLTEGLYRSLLPQLELREKMSVEFEENLLSKSDAQIAETVIKSRIGIETGVRPERPEIAEGTAFSYVPPGFIMFRNEGMRNVVKEISESEFVVGSGGKVVTPKQFEGRKVELGGVKYRMGIGGLHSCETSVSYQADSDYVIIDRDVASYYPAIILNCKLTPKHLGDNFLKVYKGIVEKRLAAKHSGDKVTSESLKITINGSFGKFGSKWSALYSPSLLIQTTVAGQLALLMLIEGINAAGAEVVSANTDGVVIRAHRNKLPQLNEAIAWWEVCTGFDTEETRYSGYYARDVNNYIAVKYDGSYKTKGAFTPSGLSKNPANDICAEAVVKLLTKGVDIEETIVMCDDIRKFLSVRTVTGGALFNDNYLGKVVRWYYQKGSQNKITYKVNGNLVPNSSGAMPLMTLPGEFPKDIDYQQYVRIAYDYLEDIGHHTGGSLA